jgi:hypothetical protein
MLESNLTQYQLSLIIIAIAIWTIPWKAIALWKAAINGSKLWFGLILIVNTLGILEIVYIFLVSKKQSSKTLD